MSSPTNKPEMIEVLAGQFLPRQNLERQFLIVCGTPFRACPICGARVVRVPLFSPKTARQSGEKLRFVTVDVPPNFQLPADYGTRHRCK